jgi:8-demethyl-8-alpha-L-rhamnosyltetracenomycin-C 2'-O-methyltransferase
MKSLDDIAIEHGTDKSSLFHNYCHKYERFLPFNRTENLNILEIGVAQGASLKMWSNFYPNSLVYGIDLSPKCWKPNSEYNNIKVLQGNQSNIDFLNDVSEKYGPFDLVIDDGSHNTKHQYITFNCLVEYLKENGVYIIEDLCTSYWNEFKQDNFSMVDFLKSLVDDLNYQGVKHKGKVFRKESLLDKVYKRKYSFSSIMFINSSCLVFN